MKLFEDKLRTRLEPAKHIEDPYKFYDSSARNDISNIRKLLNGWFERYPDSEKQELKSRFSGSFYPTFFELFLHELFSRLGFRIAIHPEIQTSSKQPDFFLSKNNFEAYAEAKEATDKTEDDEKLQNREGYLYDALNGISSPNFFLHIKKLKIKTYKQPATKSVIKKIEIWLSKLDPDFVEKAGEKRKYDLIPHFRIDNDTLLLDIAPIPRSLKSRGEITGRPIGMYPAKSFWGGSENSIKKAAERKINRYGKLTKPYLICINATGFRGIDEKDILDAIFGTQVLAHNFKTNKSTERREPDGLVFGNNGARNKNASAFFITSVLPHNLHIAKYWIYKHPFADNVIDFEQTNLAYNYIQDGEIIKQEGREIAEILDLKENWLKE